MTRRRWIADEFTEDRAWLLGTNAAHLARVLRARAGQEYDMVCGGRLRLGTIVSVSAERVEFVLREASPEPASPNTSPANTLPEETSFDQSGASRGGREIVLVAAIYKFDRMEWAIEKCTELGVTQIIPVIAHRTDSHLAAATGKRVERWRRIAHEAAQQSRRLAAPRIDEAVKLKSALSLGSLARVATARLLLNENEKSETLREALVALTRADGCEALAFAVGPEGGWTEEEVAEFGRADWHSVRLGSTILRAETAAIAALAAAAAILD
jgi:16S rRNA (uracil1498-N3)-methyltransferase